MFFKPDRNVWRVAKANRVAVLIDAANYFAAARAAMLKAERSIIIAGWDFHSQTRLVGESGRAEDGYPEGFAEFLAALVTEKPKLDVALLLWDFSMFYATERDPFPTMKLAWNTPSRVRFCLDDCVPFGSSQHQKLLVIDDALAFSGGLDLTVRRWDTSAHLLDNPLRVDQAGSPYPPFHDVQMMVDGEAAAALGELARARWLCAAYEEFPAAHAGSDPWPEHLEPDFTDIEIGIARTQPRYESQEQVREVEQLYLDCIDQAERTIYIENQFLTVPGIARGLADRLLAKPELEIVIVSPDGHEAWLEAHSMQAGRIRFAAILREADADRVYMAYPHVSDGARSTATMVHSKLMIVDDKILRVGSANLNNRSMGTDTECDLALTAKNAADRAQIVHLRNRLLGDHCGATAEQVAAALIEQGGSLIGVAKTLSRNGHCLREIEDGPASSTELDGLINGVADPEQPIGAEEFVGRIVGRPVSSRYILTLVKVVGAGLLIVALALVWQYAPFADPASVKALFASIAQNELAPVIVVAAFVVAGFVMFPVVVLIAATAAAFGPWWGFAYAALGALTSALATYAVGAAVGKRTLHDFLGPTLNRIRQRAARRGVITVAAIRMVPIAPFTVVNLVAGASAIPVFDYMAGTLIGMLPGLIVISAVGHQLARILTAPSAAELLWLAAAVAGWIAMAIGVQALVSRYWSSRS